jgi:hypothetical protein
MSVENSSAKWPWQIFNTAEFSTFGQKQAQALTEVQKECAILLQQANEEWNARAALEREMATELTNRLSAARNLSDGVTAYQDWMARRFALMTKDGQTFLANSQKFMNSMSRLLPSGGGRDVSA